MATISIEGSVVGITGFNGHLTLIYQDDSGSEFVIRGGPDASEPEILHIISKLTTETGIPIHDSEDNRPIGVTAADRGSLVIIDDGGDGSAIGTWNEMRGQAFLIGAANLEYDITGEIRNSNTVVGSVLKAVGIEVNDVLPNVEGVNGLPSIPIGRIGGNFSFLLPIPIIGEPYPGTDTEALNNLDLKLKNSTIVKTILHDPDVVLNGGIPIDFFEATEHVIVPVEEQAIIKHLADPDAYDMMSAKKVYQQKQRDAELAAAGKKAKENKEDSDGDPETGSVGVEGSASVLATGGADSKTAAEIQAEVEWTIRHDPDYRDGKIDISGNSTSDGTGKNSQSYIDSHNGSSDQHGHQMPIFIDLDGDDKVSIDRIFESSFVFNMDDDDYLEHSAWVGSNDGALVIDLAEDGTAGADGEITSLKEFAFASWNEDADSDLDGLILEFDSNGDGLFNTDDDRWDEFRIWQDANGNGVVDDGELKTLAEHDIKAIILDLVPDSDEELSDGTKLNGNVEFVKTDDSTVVGADVALTYAKDGVKITQADGETVIDFENGTDIGFKSLTDTDVDFNLGDDDAPWVSAEGNALDNILDASDKTKNVILSGLDGDDTLIGGAGNDMLFGGAGADKFDGGDGHDQIFVNEGDVFKNGDEILISGGEGYDSLVLSDDVDFSTNDIAEFGFEAVTASNLDNVIIGLDDEISYSFIGRDGNDTLAAAGGHDVLSGGEGDDTLLGNDGNDVLLGGAGVDIMHAGDGNDMVFVDDEDVLVSGGDVLVSGGEGYDHLYLARNTTLTTIDIDLMDFEAVEAGDSDNIIIGTDDEVDYVLSGNGGNDILTTAKGDDNLIGGKGNDRLEGGGGNDTYHFTRGDGEDEIYDHVEGEHIVRSVDQVAVQQQGKNAPYVNEARVGYTTVTEGEYDGGIDTLQFGYGIELSDLIISKSGTDLIIEFREVEIEPQLDADGNPITPEATDVTPVHDMITIIDGTEQNNRIETYSFSNGMKLDFSHILDGQTGYDEDDNFVGHIDDGDFLNSGKGNDTLDGQGGNDILTAGAGNDTLIGGIGKDFLFGDDGDDSLDGGEGDDYMVGGDGIDTLMGGEGNDTMSGDDGDDIIHGNAGDDLILGGKGDDKLFGGAGDDTYIYFRGDGHDEIYDNAEGIVSEATPLLVASDYERSGKKASQVEETRGRKSKPTENQLANGANDVLQFGYSLRIDDLYMETRGDDMFIGIRDFYDESIDADNMTDSILIKDWSHEENRVEIFKFGNGSAIDLLNVVHAESGLETDDTLDGTVNGDFLSGGYGNDTLTGLTGDDYLVGGAGDDDLDGGEGLDDLYGGAGDDILKGGAGADYLLGGYGNDTIFGGSGNDVITGGWGDDILQGGLGNDVYIYYRGDGKDIIDEAAFENGETDEVYDVNDNLTSVEQSGKSAKHVYLNDSRTGDATELTAKDGGFDVLQFGYGIDISDLIINTSGNNLVIDLKPLYEDGEIVDQVTINNWMADEFRIELLHFGNGFIVNIGDIDDAQTGTDEADTISALDLSTSSWLAGAEGDDFIGGSNKNDIIIGGVGDDVLTGHNGDDIYIYGRGDGHDHIIDSGNTLNIDKYGFKGDRILFGAGIEMEDLIFERDGDDLKIYITDKDDLTTNLNDIEDTITIDSGVTQRVEILEFNNGLVFDVSGIKYTYLGDDLLVDGTTEPSNDTLTGSNADDWIDGFAGDDTLTGLNGDDFIFGREGDDIISGGFGDDILVGGKGDDIIDGGYQDDILLGGEGDDTLNGEQSDDIIYGGKGNDEINGGDGDDLIVGGKGDDIIIASAGTDTYKFGYGDGNDVFVESDLNQIMATDIIQFESNISKEDIWFERVGDDLIVRLLSSDDSIRFDNWYEDTLYTHHIKGFEAQGELLTFEEVTELEREMVNFTPNDGTTAYGVTADALPVGIEEMQDQLWGEETELAPGYY